MIKKILFILTLLLIYFEIVEIPGVQAAPGNKDVVIIYTNDVHCGVDDFIGYAGLAFYKKQMQTLTPYVVLIDAGNSVQGATIGTISNGRYVVEIMNLITEWNNS